MKVMLKFTYTDLATVQLIIENTAMTLASLLGICNKVSIVKSGANVLVYVSIDKTVQGAYSSGTTPVTTFLPIDNTSEECYNNFQASATISMFVGGTSYLIPLTAEAPLNMIPDVISVPVANDNAVVFTATHFRYDCPKDTQILNGTSVSSVIVFNQNVVLKSQVKDAKNARRAEETIAYLQNAGR